MGTMLYHILTSAGMVSLGLYHLISTTRNHLRSPRDYFAKPYHPLSPPQNSSSSHGWWMMIRRPLQVYLVVLFLGIAFVHQIVISSDSDPLLKGRTPVHRFTSLQSAGVLFLFLILSLLLLLVVLVSSETPHHGAATFVVVVPPDLFFGLASAVFFLQYTVSSSSASVQTSDLQAKCDSVSARVSALSSLSCLALACLPRLFVADVALGASICLQGLWALQTGLSLYVDAFIPQGCHKLLDVITGVEGSTKCDLDDSKLRAVAILDLMFVVHVTLVVVVVMLIYAAIATTTNQLGRRFGSYEALPTSSSSSIVPVVVSATTTAAASDNHIQMKAMAGNQA